MENRYSHLLSPIKVGNIILKNRMYASKAFPHFIQGPEPFPADRTIRYYANLARNGAAVVTVKGGDHIIQNGDTRAVRDATRSKDGRHMAFYDDSDFGVQNYFSQVADAIHFYGAKACISLHRMEPDEDVNISEITQADIDAMIGDYRLFPAREMTQADIDHMIEYMTAKAKLYQSFGFDMCNLYMTYRSSILSCALTPAVNKRTDKYGGSVRNRCQLAIELCQSIKKACGRDFLIEAQITGEEESGGYTLQDTIEMCKYLEGYVDILHIRGLDGSDSHPTGFNSRKGKNSTLRIAEALKSSGTKIVIAPNGGYQDLDMNERIIAEGKADMLVMARAFICDYDYLKKAEEGRGEDVVPCVRCNKCHVPSLDGPWVSVCTVNPMQGIAYLSGEYSKQAESKRRVAVIGGGPAGMAAAMYSAQRGHSVTLFEKTGTLGGQLKHADFPSFKWPLRDYKDYLISQITKLGVDIRLNTPATPELIAQGEYDAVIAATGAVSRRPPVKGADSPEIWTPIDVFGHESQLGHKVVIVGGAETGVETGMYLAENGHEVTVLTRQNKLAADATPIHYYEMLSEAWAKLPNFGYELSASALSVTPGSVTYSAADGEKTIFADSVVVCGGVSPCADEAMAFGGLTPRYFAIGDCAGGKNVHDCTRTAFSAAVRL